MRIKTHDARLPLLVAAALVYALLDGGRLPYYILILGAGVLLGAYFWARYTLVRIGGSVRLEGEHGEIGKPIQVHFRLTNRSALPISWAEIDTHMPAALGEIDVPRHASSLSPRTSRSIRCRFTPQRRGHYPMGPIRVTTGDPFGLFQGQRQFFSTAGLTVYPRIHAIPGFSLTPTQPLGSIRTRNQSFEDPSNPAELRPYRPGDNPRHIHWKATARQGEMMVREYKMDATTPVLLFLDMAAAAYPARTNSQSQDDTAEMAVELAASLAQLGFKQKVSIGLFCSAQEPHRVPARRSHRALHEILEVLARVEDQGPLPVERLVAAETSHLSVPSTLVVITPHLSPNLAETLVRVRTKHRVILILLQGLVASPLMATLAMQQVDIYLVSDRQDISRLAERQVGSGMKGVNARWPDSRPFAIR